MSLKQMIETNKLIDEYLVSGKTWEQDHIVIYNLLRDGKVSKLKQKQFKKHKGVSMMEMLMQIYYAQFANNLNKVQLYALRLGDTSFINTLFDFNPESKRGVAQEIVSYIRKYETDALFLKELREDLKTCELDNESLLVVDKACSKIYDLESEFNYIINTNIDRINAEKLKEDIGEDYYDKCLAELPNSCFANSDRVLKVIKNVPCTSEDLTGSFTIDNIIKKLREATYDHRRQVLEVIFTRIIEQRHEAKGLGGCLNDEEKAIWDRVYKEVKPSVYAKQFSELVEELKGEDLTFDDIREIMGDLREIEVKELFSVGYISVEDADYYSTMYVILTEIEWFEQDTYKINQFSEDLLSEPRVYEEIERLIYKKVENLVYNDCIKNERELTEVEEDCLIAKLAEKKIVEFYKLVKKVNKNFKPAQYDSELLEEVNEI